MTTRLTTERLVLRPWARGDEAALVRHANDREVWRGLEDRFPHPYTRDDAAEWIERVQSQGDPPLSFAALLEGEPIGGVGLRRHDDVYSHTASLGYWIGRELWGRGLATEASARLVRYAFGELVVERLEARAFDWNRASVRVLEKCGFELEGRMRRAVFKDGRFLDCLLYARLRPRG